MSLTKESVSYKPFKYPWAVEMVTAHEKMHWGEWEARLSDDVIQWKTDALNANEKNHITQILRLFTQSDVAVGQNYYNVFLPRIKNNEVRVLLGSFANREGVHQRAYALLNDTLELDEKEYTAFLEYAEMSEKIEYMLESDPDTPEGFAAAIAKSVFSEGCSLFAAFAMLLNYQRRGLMKGMCEVVEWSIRDESLHVEGMTQLFKSYIKENPQVVTEEFKVQVYDMARKMYELEENFIDLAYEMGPVEGLTKDEMKLYVKYIIDRRLIQLGMKPNFGVKENPLEWLDWIVNGDSLKNFFEGVVTDYDAESLSGDWGWD